MNFKKYDLESKRKIFHCSAIIFPLIYLFSTKLTMIIILMIFTGIVMSIDISRHYNRFIQDIVDKLFHKLMRPYEKSGNFKLSGVSYMFLGFFISSVIYSKGTAISSFMVLIISDAAAAIVGQKKYPDSEEKSIEGSIAFCVTAILIGMLSYSLSSFHANFFSIILASIITTFAEYYSKSIGVSDNLIIPIIYGAAISIHGFTI